MAPELTMNSAFINLQRLIDTVTNPLLVVRSCTKGT